MRRVCWVYLRGERDSVFTLIVLSRFTLSNSLKAFLYVFFKAVSDFSILKYCFFQNSAPRLSSLIFSCSSYAGHMTNSKVLLCCLNS